MDTGCVGNFFIMNSTLDIPRGPKVKKKVIVNRFEVNRRVYISFLNIFKLHVESECML